MKLLTTKPAAIALAIAAALTATHSAANEIPAEQQTKTKEQVQAKDTAQAQDAEVERIQVTGIRNSIKEGMFLKQNAVSVVDLVVADDIGKFPDENLAEALQRIPGVTITRNGGEGQDRKSVV